VVKRLLKTRDGNFDPVRPDPPRPVPPRRGDGAVAGYRNCPDTRGGAVTDFVCPAPPRPEDISIIAPRYFSNPPFSHFSYFFSLPNLQPSLTSCCRLPPTRFPHTSCCLPVRNSESPTKHELESPTARWQRRQR
jgi:hypothetical protein